MSANWTEQNLRDYTQRRLKDEEPRRLEMQAKAQRRAMQEAAAKKVAGSGNWHNPQVVMAFFRHHGLRDPVPEYRFHMERRWRFDFAWPESKIFIEVQGGLWNHGAHTRGAALLREYAKYNEATALGWRPIFVTPQQLCTQETVSLIRRSLAAG